MHFCLIDDDPTLLASLSRGLTELGHECETFDSPVAGLDRMLDAELTEPDLLLLDVMMPEMDGWEVLSRIREAGRSTAVIYVSARRDVDDRVHGLRLTADDYVVKPFALAELLARSESVLRRRGILAPMRFGRLVVHRSPAKVEVEGRVVEVSAREHAFLVLLCESPGRVFSRPELLEQLWGIDFDPGTNLVEVLVARLRRKLGTASCLVETVVGQGYQVSGAAS